MASNIDKWLKAGYDLLAAEEMDGINVERLARALNANKSGFYHYFGTKEVYYKQLVGYHFRRAEIVASEINRCSSIDPDLFQVIMREKTFFLAEAQLFVKGKPLKSKLDATAPGKIISKEVVALWRRLHETAGDVVIPTGTVDIIRHFFYARIDAQNISYKFLRALADEIKMMLNSNTANTMYDSANHGLQDPLD